MGSGNANRPSPLFLRLIFGRNPAWTVVRILLVVFLSLALFKFVLVPIQVTGNSMDPTFRNGQIKFVNKLAYKRSEPQRGDIVAAYYAGEQVLLLKRIVALPGEVFRLKDGEVYINNRKLIEPYANGKMPFEKGLGWTKPVTLGPDEYLVIGDNRKISEGYFKYRHELVGKVL
jgi:signal peptidase I